MNPAHVLIVDDELAVIQGCSRTLTRNGYLVDTALTPAEAIDKIMHSEQIYDVLIIDLKMAGDFRDDLLKRLKQFTPDSAIIFIIGQATVAAAIETMIYGSHEYMAKPFSGDDLTETFMRALQQRAMLLQAREASSSDAVVTFRDLVWTGQTMQKLFRLISRIAPTGTNILMIGASGTGKLQIAEAIHRASQRRLEPFVAFDMLRSKSLSISEQLFGYVIKEAAVNKHIPGKIEEAGNGTLYLSEITGLNTNDQARLLSAIKAHGNIPLRGIDRQPLSCRMIFATEQSLQLSSGKCNLIEEFYHNLMVFPLYIPSLSERTEDIPTLSYQLLHRYAWRDDKPITKLDEGLLTRLLSRQWKANLRELSQCIERMVSVCDGDTLDLSHYQEVMGEGVSVGWSGLPPTTAEELKTVKKKLRQVAVEEVEKAFINEALRRSGGNVTRAAENTGMQRRNFQTMMRHYGILASE